MPRKIMTQLICTDDVAWTIGYGPKKDEIVTLKMIHPQNDDFLVFYEYYNVHNGYPDAFNKKYFAEVADITELTEILEQQPEHA